MEEHSVLVDEGVCHGFVRLGRPWETRREVDVRPGPGPGTQEMAIAVVVESFKVESVP